MSAPSQDPNPGHAPEFHPDPITGEPGSHPLGTGIGAAGGAAAGAALGALGGPVGASIGGVIGAIAGGLAGKGVAEKIDPTAEEAYWRENFHREPYYEEDKDFADYGPAYQMSVARYEEDARFEDHEAAMAEEWDSAKGSSTLHWLQARAAAKAGWDRLHRRRDGSVGDEGPI
jgi:phage tail tape-measure protein